MCFCLSPAVANRLKAILASGQPRHTAKTAFEITVDQEYEASCHVRTHGRHRPVMRKTPRPLEFERSKSSSAAGESMSATALLLFVARFQLMANSSISTTSSDGTQRYLAT
jgi:hypothetical protein